MIFLILFFVFTFFRVPETKGRTFEEIAQIFGSAPPASVTSVQEVDVVTVRTPTAKEKVPLVAAKSEEKEKLSFSGGTASEAETGKEKPESASKPLVTSTTEATTIQESV